LDAQYSDLLAVGTDDANLRRQDLFIASYALRLDDSAPRVTLSIGEGADCTGLSLE
jgi:hypothetical protein